MTQLPSGPISPERSASGMNEPGITRPWVGCCQRNSASMPVMRHAGMGEIEQLARQGGMRTMYEDGLAKALAGQTTIEEVLRVTEEA